METEPNYHVIEVDYSSHAIVYSCRPFFWFLGKQEELWVLSRTNTIEDTKLTTIRQTITDKLGYDSNLWSSKTDQTNCDYTSTTSNGIVPGPL